MVEVIGSIDTGGVMGDADIVGAMVGGTTAADAVSKSGIALVQWTLSLVQMQVQLMIAKSLVTMWMLELGLRTVG